MEFFRAKDIIRFMSQAKRWGILSLLLVLVSWGMIATKGFNFGTDFAGGTLIQIKYDKPIEIESVRKIIDLNSKLKGAQVTHFGSENEIVIKTKTMTNSVTNDLSDEVSRLLKPTGNFEVRRADMVGPKIGNELQTKGIMSVLVALAGILLYVSFRFEWRFAVASIVALVHDLSITLGFLSLFDIEVNLDVLAALLTLLGYSINDTIIVFDRIRESILTDKDSKLDVLIDSAVTKTLSRTTLTSMTTIFVILSLYLFGGEIIKGFSFTLLIGIAVGTYSSIFIASPLLLWMGFDVKKYRAKIVEKQRREKEKDKLRAMYEQGRV